MTREEARTLLIPIKNDYKQLAETKEEKAASSFYELCVKAIDMAISALEAQDGDCISRTAAIDEMHAMNPTEDYLFLDEVVQRLENLPSVQRWIPVSERLPEDNGEYLVTRESNGLYKYIDIVKKTNVSAEIASDIKAWIPLPEPYQEESV